MNNQHSALIEQLRAREQRKLTERLQPHRHRQQAMRPVEQFVDSLAAAGEISRFDLTEDGCTVSILVCSQMRDTLPGGGSIQIACTQAWPARTAGEVFWRMTVDAAGHKPRAFSGTSDYRHLFGYLVMVIADQRLMGVE